jgi:hypothetical protein
MSPRVQFYLSPERHSRLLFFAIPSRVSKSESVALGERVPSQMGLLQRATFAE